MDNLTDGDPNPPPAIIISRNSCEQSTMNMDAKSRLKINIFAAKAQADACFRNKQYKIAINYYEAAIGLQQERIREGIDSDTTESYLNLQEALAETFESLAIVYNATNKMKECEKCFITSLRMYRKVCVGRAELGLDETLTVIRHHNACNMAGNMFYRRQKYTKAGYFYKMAIDTPWPSSLCITDPNDIFDSDEPELDLDVCITCNDEKDADYAHMKVLLCEAEALHNMANVNSVLGDPASSKILYLKALKIQTDILGENDIHVATTMQNIATSYFRNEDYDTALQMYRKVLQCIIQSECAHHPLEFDALVGIGLTLAKTGNSADALVSYKEALQLPQQNQRLKEKQAAVHNEMGLIYKEGGDEESALNHFYRSLEMYQSFGFKRKHPQVQAVLSNIEAMGLKSFYDPHIAKAFDFSKLSTQLEVFFQNCCGLQIKNEVGCGAKLPTI
mmetsp:Transcript_3211/g.4784  ORF Transcript_3211/g.4784 Transcript_3211/m.4784 type:complete len:448 (-) Transcript_3211:159-1502(-)